MASLEDESSLNASLESYKLQLVQVEDLLHSDDGLAIQEDLRQLQTDLREVIQLTEETIENKRLNREHLEQNASLPHSSQPVRNQFTSSPDSQFSTLSTHLDNNAGDNLDDEYAAFQGLLGEHLMQRSSVNGMGRKSDNADVATGDCDKSKSDYDSSDKDDEEAEDNGASDRNDEDEEFDGDSSQDDDLFGQKCRAPFYCSWGPMSYNNAMILSRIKPDSSADESEVEVVFCNPTHVSMQPCPYYLSGCCRFDRKTCRYSHGERVKSSDLRPYQHPDFSNVALGTQCVARDEDDLWYDAIIVEILEDSQFQIQFEANHQLKTVPIKDIFPVVESQTDDTSRLSAGDDDDDDPEGQEDAVPSLSSLRPKMTDFKTTDALGQWETHTKGIGSKLMAKMGYIAGQGLGRNNEGRAEPVPINLLPKGITLDKIMELKDAAQNGDLFSALKKQKRKQKTQNRGKKSEATRGHKMAAPSVFHFINNKLHQPKGQDRGSLKCRSSRTAKDTKFISTHELKEKSEKHLNIQLLKTNAEIKNTQRQISRLQDSLERAIERGDHNISKEIKRKLDSLNGYTSQLKTSESFIKNQKKNRKAQDLLTKF